MRVVWFWAPWLIQPIVIERSKNLAMFDIKPIEILACGRLLSLICCVLTVISVSSANLASAAGASAPLSIVATVVANCNLSSVETIVDQDNATASSAPLTILCARGAVPFVRVNYYSSGFAGTEFNPSTSVTRPYSDRKSSMLPSLPKLSEGSYTGNLTITVNF